MTMPERDTTRTLQIISMGAFTSVRQMYQYQHALLIPLLSWLFLMTISPRQCFVYGCHGGY
jgi:hypothetical protein